jgi:ssDNA-binding Zn-finger/Zn-ribbon topoisomerase 1
MSQQYYVGTCPVCEQGLCRVRIYDSNNQFLSCVVCDECDATWTDTSLCKSSRFRQPGSEVSVFPGSDIDLWGEPTRWANADDLLLLGWSSKNFVDA